MHRNQFMDGWVHFETVNGGRVTENQLVNKWRCCQLAFDVLVTRTLLVPVWRTISVLHLLLLSQFIINCIVVLQSLIFISYFNFYIISIVSFYSVITYYCNYLCYHPVTRFVKMDTSSASKDRKVIHSQEQKVILMFYNLWEEKRLKK